MVISTWDFERNPDRGPNLVSVEEEEEEEKDKDKKPNYEKTQNIPPTLISYFVVFQAAL